MKDSDEEEGEGAEALQALKGGVKDVPDQVAKEQKKSYAAQAGGRRRRIQKRSAPGRRGAKFGPTYILLHSPLTLAFTGYTQTKEERLAFIDRPNPISTDLRVWLNEVDNLKDLVWMMLNKGTTRLSA